MHIGGAHHFNDGSFPPQDIIDRLVPDDVAEIYVKDADGDDVLVRWLRSFKRSMVQRGEANLNKAVMDKMVEHHRKSIPNMDEMYLE